MVTKRKDNKGRILRDGESQRADGRYEYKYYDVKGERKSIYSWRLTEADPMPAGKKVCSCLRELEKLLIRDVQDGLLTQQKQTLNDRWDLYIGNKPELKQSTKTNYKYMYNKYIRDEIGNLQLTSVKYSTVKAFFNKLIYENGFKPASVEIIYTILHPVFVIAMRDGLIRLNPTEGIMADLKRSNDWEKTKRHSLTEDEQRRFLNYIKNHKKYSHWYSLFVCLLGTGCRIGEFLGLRWEDIDLEKDLISINHSLVYRLQDNGKVEFHITSPKTRNSIRLIPMFKNVKQAFQTELDRQKQKGFCKDSIDGYSGFIWMNRFGNIMCFHNINRAIDRIVRDYNLEEKELAQKENRDPIFLPDFSCHHLRHTFCTRLCENETDLKLIQEIMGHADISTTMDVYNESNIERKKMSFAKLESKNSIF